MNDICFCNVSFGQRYVQTQERLRDSILKIYPSAKLFFWTDSFPPNSKTHEQSYYGFKVHAVQHAREQGFKKVVWIDTCAILNNPIEPLLEVMKDGFFVIRDENKLYRFTGQWFRKLYRIDPTWHLLGGSIYIFDFNHPVGTKIFEDWRRMEAEGMFGAADEKYAEENDGIENCGHRFDETVMAYCMYTNGVQPFDPDTGRYNQNETSVVLKKHFLNVGEKWYDK